MSDVLTIPALVPSYVVRADEEESVAAAVRSGRSTVVVGIAGKTQACIGKTCIVVSTLARMLREGTVKQVFWIDFSHYRHEKVPFRIILGDVANRLIETFGESLYTSNDENRSYSHLDEDGLVDYIRGLTNYLVMKGVSTNGPIWEVSLNIKALTSECLEYLKLQEFVVLAMTF